MKKLPLTINFLMVIGFSTALAQEPNFDGKTVRIVVGFSAGGGFDAYARAIARHMGKHIPGKPSVIVDNMPGAGSLIAANHVYNQAKPDGLTISHFIGGVVVGQVLAIPQRNSIRRNLNGSVLRRN